MQDNSVKALVVDGVTLPMHSTYSFELKKVYVDDPKRVNNGSIPIFPEKFFVPYFTVSWAVISIEDYRKVMKLIEKDENIVQYYDQTDNSYKISKFYAQQPTFNKLYSMEKKYNIVLNLQIVFAGTLNDVGDITIQYDSNGGTGNIQSQTGVNGEEFVINNGTDVSRLNYAITSWNTRSDGLGDTYQLGGIGVFTSNLTLYAQWRKLQTYTLSLAYDVGEVCKDSQQNEINSIPVRYKQEISGLPTSVIVVDSNGDELIDDYGDSVYTFVGWNKNSQSKGEGAYVANGDLYNVDGDSTVYTQFDIKSYTITFNSDGGSSQSPITAKYSTRISLPTPTKDGYSFAGWYEEQSLTTLFSDSYMPYRNLTLYAKWNEV